MVASRESHSNFVFFFFLFFFWENGANWPTVEDKQSAPHRLCIPLTGLDSGAVPPRTVRPVKLGWPNLHIYPWVLGVDSLMNLDTGGKPIWNISLFF